jgi:membrane-associated phospholipid phosphatase
VYLGYHWASDVVGGWLLAIVICTAAAFAVSRLSDSTTGVKRPLGRQVRS